MCLNVILIYCIKLMFLLYMLRVFMILLGLCNKLLSHQITTSASALYRSNFDPMERNDNLVRQNFRRRLTTKYPAIGTETLKQCKCILSHGTTKIML